MVYPTHPTQLNAEPMEGASETNAIFPNFSDSADALETWYNDRFLIGLRHATKISEYWNGCCFNCEKKGHHWHQCKEPLFPELQEFADNQDKE